MYVYDRPTYLVREITPEARRLIEEAGGQILAQPEEASYLVSHPLEASSATGDGWLLMELPTGMLWYEEKTGRLEGKRTVPPAPSAASAGVRTRPASVPVGGCPWSERGISISGSWCWLLWALALVVNGLCLAKGRQPPPSWPAWGLDELAAGILLGGWLLLTCWRQRRLWLVGALLLIGALWLASWI